MHDRFGLGYRSSSFKVKVEVPSYAKVTYGYGIENTPRVNHAVVTLGPMKLTKVGSSRWSSMS